MIAALAFLRSVPRWAWLALACVVFVIGMALYINAREKAAVEADRARSSAEAVSRAREADERAHRAAQGKSQEVSDANERARKAAAGSDDPLRAAFDSLRAGQDRDGEAAR